MPDAGVMETRGAVRPARRWIDFGVDESWEAAPARSREADRPLVAPSRAGAPSRAATPSRTDTPSPAARAARPARAPRAARVEAITPVAPSPIGSSAAVAAPPRRTVQIRGRGAEGYAWPDAATARRAADRRAAHRGPSPDRMALWAVLLGLLLVLVAATSSHAAALSHRLAARPATAARVARVDVLDAPRRAPGLAVRRAR